MLPALVIAVSLASTNAIVETNGPPVVFRSQYVPVVNSAASSSMQVIKDRVDTVSVNATVSSSYVLSCSEAGPIISDTTSVADALDGPNTMNWVANGEAWALAITLDGTFTADISMLRTMPASFTNFYAYNQGTLGSNVNWATSNLYQGKHLKQWAYFPNQPDVSTNQNCWTWPVNLSCLGFGSDSLQHCLISPHLIIANNHYGGSPHSVQFLGQDGKQYVARVNTNYACVNDFAIGILESNISAQVTPAWVFFPTFTNCMTDLTGTQTVWTHKNTQHLDLANVVAYPFTAFYAGGFGLQVFNARTNIFGNENGASGGDSGSPCFMILSNQPVLLFTTTSSGDAIGDFISNPSYWECLRTNVGVGTNGLSIIDQTGYPAF